MNRRKKTSRRRWTPLAAFGALDAYDDLLGGFDIEDELSELEDLLGDPFDRAVMASARMPDLGAKPTAAGSSLVGQT